MISVYFVSLFSNISEYKSLNLFYLLSFLGVVLGNFSSTIRDSISSNISGNNFLMKSFGIPRYGFVLISNSQVLKSSSIRKSNPNSSNKLSFFSGFQVFLTERKESMIRSYILGIICFSKLKSSSGNFSLKYFSTTS